MELFSPALSASFSSTRRWHYCHGQCVKDLFPSLVFSPLQLPRTNTHIQNSSSGGEVLQDFSRTFSDRKMMLSVRQVGEEDSLFIKKNKMKVVYVWMSI